MIARDTYQSIAMTSVTRYGVQCPKRSCCDVIAGAAYRSTAMTSVIQPDPLQALTTSSTSIRPRPRLNFGAVCSTMSEHVKVASSPCPCCQTSLDSNSPSLPSGLPGRVISREVRGLSVARHIEQWRSHYKRPHRRRPGRRTDQLHRRVQAQGQCRIFATAFGSSLTRCGPQASSSSHQRIKSSYYIA